MEYKVLSVILCLLKFPVRLFHRSVADVDILHHPEALCYSGSWTHDSSLCPNLDDGHVRLFVPALLLHSSNSGLFAARAITQRATSAGEVWAYLGD